MGFGMVFPYCSRPQAPSVWTRTQAWPKLEEGPPFFREHPVDSVIIIAHNSKMGNWPCRKQHQIGAISRAGLVVARANYIWEGPIMRATGLVEKLRGRSPGKSLGKEFFDGYERRLIQWGCTKCQFFEKRVFRSGLPSEELDAYMICRFAGEVVDLIGEACACPKGIDRGQDKSRSQSVQLPGNGANRQIEVRSFKRPLRVVSRG
jgi:hypothetical protein